MKIHIFALPYDSGNKHAHTGNGPLRFLEAGLHDILRQEGHHVSVSQIESNQPYTTEIGTTMELDRILAEKVKRAIANERFPLVLSGNCNSCLGTISGIGAEWLGVIWLDAHGDFNTPETTTSGFFDGMPLAMAAGRCWEKLAKTIPGFAPIGEANVIHIGGRDLDAAEEKLMEQSAITVIPPSKDVIKQICPSLDALKQEVQRVYLHVDMDVLDAGEAKPNRLATSGGLKVEQVVEIIGLIKERFEVAAAAITSFDPAYDVDDVVLNTGINIINTIAAYNEK